MAKTASNGRAVSIKRFFGQRTEVSIHIDAPTQKIWELLTDVARFASWNSTVLEMTGQISSGERIALRSTLAPQRTFKLKVKEFEPPTRLSWGDAMGTRVFVLTPAERGGTHFSMSESIGGPLFPLFARLIPSFDASFEQFAADVKKAAQDRVQ